MTEPLITVSGPPGSGTTTTARKLAERFGFEHVSGGDIFRNLADDRGLTLDEITKLAEEDDSIDRDLDARLEDIAEAHATGERDCDGAGLILESRLAGWLAGDHADIRMYLDAPVDVRVQRIGDRTETAEQFVEREESEARRYQEYYDIDVRDRSIYDLVMDTSIVGETEMLAIAYTTVGALVGHPTSDYLPE